MTPPVTRNEEENTLTPPTIEHDEPFGTIVKKLGSYEQLSKVYNHFADFVDLFLKQLPILAPSNSYEQPPLATVFEHWSTIL
jgi:hypothetical protein